MKTKKTTWPWVLPLLAGTITLSSVHAQQTSTTEWDADPEAPENWQDSGSWSAGVPVVDSLAGIRATRVEEGTLLLAQPYIADNGNVFLTTGAVLELDHSATDTISGAPNTNYICLFSDDLVTPFAPIATDPETVTTDGNGGATCKEGFTVRRNKTSAHACRGRAGMNPPGPGCGGGLWAGLRKSHP